ncbi:gamma-glutamyl AIG2-like cyclotransferase [Lentzea atacamensis]|uniref:Gamma-glutamyl AIG2-like cyclotransferase n=1 Tax=Lentzea atacamensis TaxID=531938 RepID=A0ABX9ED18_9PSEU|nr:gamma-glutamylcyclotransferase [Lentzea atacamensis]RAS66823.1 gamma-glutamyl AIG2-like cyclotransferase [Lentzea atacamensis]
MITPRARVLGRIADHLTAQLPGRPLRVAVDGITAAGKTTLARELTAAVAARGRAAAHLSMDGFHNPRAVRHRQGRDSADGYYADAYDFASFQRLVLDPLGPGGDRKYRERIIDLHSDTPIDEPPVEAPEDLVLVVDGSFLQRELVWDEVVFVDTPFEVAHERGTRRDTELLGGLDQARRAFEQRYHAASRRYLDEVGPAESATVVLGNEDVANPVLRRIGGPADAVVNLFSYGTLQTPSVQIEHFGRTLVGKVDVLPGYRQDWVTITDPAVVEVSGTDRHPIVRHTGDPADATSGTMLEVTAAELAAADIYEVDDYRRALVRLGSGADAWVYLAN